MAVDIRIATRESELALWQANYVKARLHDAHPGANIDLVGMTTEGDRNQHSSLSKIGGKGLFVKELELALQQNRADIAVHSMKDVPAILPDGLEIAAICEREDPRDAFVSNDFGSLDAMPKGSKLGSSSLRRRLQVKRRYPDFEYLDLRGNVQTRLRKLDEGQYDAVILAVAGLKRLELDDRITACIDTDLCIPAAGQGAVGIECRADDTAMKALLDSINHEPTRVCVSAERTLSTALEAHCNLPIGAFGELNGDRLRLSAFVSDVAGTEFLKEVVEGPASDAPALGEKLCEMLLDRGARELVSASRD